MLTCPCEIHISIHHVTSCTDSSHGGNTCVGHMPPQIPTAAVQHQQFLLHLTLSWVSCQPLLTEHDLTAVVMDTLQATTELMAYMVEYTSGVICVGMEGADLDRLKLPLMVSSVENEEVSTTQCTCQ